MGGLNVCFSHKKEELVGQQLRQEKEEGDDVDAGPSQVMAPNGTQYYEVV